MTGFNDLSMTMTLILNILILLCSFNCILSRVEHKNVQ